MKAIKKLLAIVLTVCMLIGMPLSIDVAATGNPNGADAFHLQSAMIIPDSWGTSLNGDTQMALYFNGGPINIDTTKIKAYVGIGNAAANSGWYDGEQRTSIAGLYFTGTLSKSDDLLGGTAKAGHRNPNVWIFTIEGAKTSWALTDLRSTYRSQFDSAIDTLPEMMKLAKMSVNSSGATTNSQLMIKLAEIDGTTGDGVIDGITKGDGTKLKTRTSATTLVNLNDGNLGGTNDGTWARVYDAETAPQMTAVTLNDSTKTLTVNFNDKVNYAYRGNSFVYSSIRVINNRGMIHGYDESTGKFHTYKSNTAGLLSMGFTFEKDHGGIITYGGRSHTYTLSDDQYANVKKWQGWVDAHNATAAEADQLMVALIMEEQNIWRDNTNKKNPTLIEACGDGHQNHWFEMAWNDAGAPFMPTYTDMDGWVADCMAQEIRSIDEIKADAVTIEQTTVLRRQGAADRVIVEFSEPVTFPGATNNIDAHVRVFDAAGNLKTHNKDTMQLTSTNSGHLQWAVSSWTKRDYDGKVWIGNLNNNYGCDTLDEINAYVGKLKNADGTAASGLSVQISLVDRSAYNVGGNHLVDSITAVADSSKKLYAPNVMNGEERGTCPVATPLEVVDASFYADTLAIITFSKDIDLNKAIASINGGTNAFWLTAYADAVNAGGGDPVKDGAGHMHVKLTNARVFGNATNKLMFDLSGSWNDFKTRMEAYEKANGKALDYAIRVEGGGRAYSAYVKDIESTDGQRLYRNFPANDPNNAGWGGRYTFLVTNHADVEVLEVVPNVHNNSIVVEFSEPVKYTDAKNASNGSRTQAAISRFHIADNGSMNLTHKTNGKIPTEYQTLTDGTGSDYQAYETSYTASDANGNKVNDAYSKYWTFYFAEGVVDGMVNYYADKENNTEYDEHIGYGFALYEDYDGDKNGNYGEKLTLGAYLEDFATAPDANGKVKYLRSNSTSWGQRYFKAPTIKADSLVETQSVKILNDKLIEVTFSEPVKEVGTNAWVSLRVATENSLVLIPGETGTNNSYQSGSNGNDALVPVNPDADGYATVWHYNSPASITQFANDKYFNDTVYADKDVYDLTFSIEGNGNHKTSGAVVSLQNKDGMGLKASDWVRGGVGVYVSIKNDPAFTEGAVALYNGASYTSVEAAVEAAKTNGGTVTMIRDDVFTGQNGISVAATVVLDLAGKTLDLGTGSLVGNGHVIDSTNGNGLVKIEYLEENQTANFVTNNPQLPLYDSAKGGYRLFNTKVNALGTKDKTDDACKYGFNVTFDNEEAYALFADVTHNDTTVSFKLETARLDESKKVVPLSEDAPTTYVNNKNAEPTKTWAFTLKITGLAALNGDPLTVSGMIYSAGVTMDVEIPVS